VKVKKLFKKLILCLIPFLTNNLGAMEGGSPPQDPLIRMNYRMAFDQKKNTYYLHGHGGIGKTYFVNHVRKSIEFSPSEKYKNHCSQ